MNATLIAQDTTNRHEFNVKIGENEYGVTVYTNSKGKFIDESILFRGSELEYEGDEGQIREDIMEYLDENWDKLTAETYS